MLVPIKSFRDAKGRLAAVFSPEQRAELGRRERVVLAGEVSMSVATEGACADIA